MIFLSEHTWEVKESGEKGKGLFTINTIPPGTVIGDYTGIVIHPMDADNYEKGKHFYLMYYHDYASIFPDLSKPDLYLLNHSCEPNCWMYTYKGHTLFFSLRHIFPGEELTVSYLLSPKDRLCEPCTHVCHCESIICNQTMHTSEQQYKLWKKASSQITGITKRERIRKGKELPLLAAYPASIPDHPVYTLFANPQVNPQVIMVETLPSHEEIRSMIRNSGRILAFPKLGVSIRGVLQEKIITE